MTSHLNAAEFVRRAERGLGVAIREGQESGTVAKRGDIGAMGRDGTRGGLPGSRRGLDLIRPTDLAKSDELSGSRPGIYAMTDGVSGEQFEEAISEAKAEGNLSRANVARNCRCLDCRRPLHVAKSVAAQRGPKCRARRAVG